MTDSFDFQEFGISREDELAINGKVVYSGYNAPIKFIDNIESKKHIVLFYEEPEYAKKPLFQFIKNGLKKEQHCVYAMKDDPALIKQEMLDFGIDVEKYEKKQLLHIFQTPISQDYSQQSFESFNDFYQMIMSGITLPVRVVSTFVREVHKKEAMKFELSIETDFQTNLQNFSGVWVCPYYLKKIESNNCGRWIVQLLKTHDSAIFIRSFDEGIAFNIF